MMFIAQKNGVVKSYVGGQVQNFIDISGEVNDVRDRGLLGMAVHPDFVNSPYVYLLYTYDPPETVGQTGLAAPDQYGNRVARLLRVTADVANGYRTAVPGSAEVLLGKNSTWANISFPNLDGTDNVNLPATGVGIEDIIGVDSQSHSVGALRFGTDGSLFISNGDGTSYGRVDPRSALVQDITDFRGKVLRINPLTGEGYTNNPFYNGNLNADQSKVFNYGLRNPFRMAIHPTLGLPYVGDVGWNTHEEINIGAGQNFGWPWYEGVAGANAQTGGYRDLPRRPRSTPATTPTRRSGRGPTRRRRGDCRGRFLHRPAVPRAVPRDRLLYRLRRPHDPALCSWTPRALFHRNWWLAARSARW